MLTETRILPAFAGTAPTRANRVGFGAIAQPQPLFGSRDYETPDLAEAWRTPESRFLLEKTIRNGMFKQAPALAEGFLNEIARLSKTHAGKDAAYEALAGYLRRPENKRLFESTFDGDESLRYDKRFRQMTDLVPRSHAPDSYADIGCGTGSLASKLAVHWNIDSENAYGLEVFPREENALNLQYQVYDGKHTGLPDNRLGLATLMMVLHHVEDPDQMIREAYRILKPGGRLIVREVDAPTHASQLYNDVMDHIYYKVIHQYPDIPTPANHFPADEWKRRFMDAGFIVERTVYPEPDNPFKPVHFVLRKP